MAETQEAAFCPGLIINPRSRQIPTEGAQSLSWEATSPRGWRGKPAPGVEVGIVCEYLLDYNAVGYCIILHRALNKVIMGEVIFVIKLAVTVGHKSQVLVLKKLLNMPPLPHTVLLLNTLILLQILHWLRWGKYTQWANDSFRPSSSRACIWASRNDFLRCDVIYGVLSLSKRQTASRVTPEHLHHCFSC